MDAQAPRKGRLQRVLDNSGTAAFFGAIVGGLLTGFAGLSVAIIQEVGETSRLAEQLAAEDRREQAALRLDAYRTYLTEAEEFKFHAIDRVTTCKPGSDAPLHEDRPCVVPLLSTYQASRFDVQAAVNEIHRVGSDEGIAAMQTMAGALPSTLVRGETPVEEMPDVAVFSEGYDALLDVMKCETVPVAPNWCPGHDE